MEGRMIPWKAAGLLWNLLQGKPKPFYLFFPVANNVHNVAVEKIVSANCMFCFSQFKIPLKS